MYRKNCRYSDCQFSATSTAKLDDVRYCPRLTCCSPSVSCWLLYSATPVRACPARAARNISPKNNANPWSRHTVFMMGPRSPVQQPDGDEVGQPDRDGRQVAPEGDSHRSSPLHGAVVGAFVACGAPGSGDQPVITED